MTTTVTVKVPAGASYVARVTTFQTASKTEEDVQPGTERMFYASSSCTLQIAEAPIEAVENPELPAQQDTRSRGEPRVPRIA